MYFGENFFELSTVDGEDEEGNEEGSSLHFKMVDQLFVFLSVFIFFVLLSNLIDPS